MSRDGRPKTLIAVSQDAPHCGSDNESDSCCKPPPKKPTRKPDDSKKKKKKRIPAQKSINLTWKKFSDRKFHKALSVLPFDPVAPPCTSDTPNELLSEGYERAAEECRRKVNKIINECKRINVRYRDPGWDLDWDLKYQKGHCLNGLLDKPFRINHWALLGPSPRIPKAVKRVHEIFEKPTFLSGVSPGDIKQGSLGDCWIVASMTAMANVEDGIKRACVAYNSKIGIYGFVFYRDGEWVYSIVDDKLFLTSPSWDSPSFQRNLLEQIDREDVEKVYRKTYQTGSKALFFSQCKDQNETWVPLMEKAYAKAHGDYASLQGGWIGEGLEDLSGGVTTELFTSDILDVDEFWDNEMSKVNKEFMFGCSTGLAEYGYGSRNGICEGHAYVVMDARTLKSGQRLVKLRNPWGQIREGIWEGPWSDGSKEWTREVQDELDHKFGSDSVFWISYEDLLLKYTHFDRTRLFRDPDWRCCQRWISVDVPWKPEYHERFNIKLTKESPLVLVLSQIDERYFRGLAGQYTFRLHFRFHHKDRQDAEDYIVRSHGNYFMSRSVSVELPSMEAGEYTLFLKVTAERDSRQKSVEEVVKDKCKDRVEDEKLAQVGCAYDLAHSKAWHYIEDVDKIRKQKLQDRASSSRRKERRRQWEKRHMTRTVRKKQSEKNKKKKEEEDKKKKEEEEKKKSEVVEDKGEDKKEDEKKAENVTCATEAGEKEAVDSQDTATSTSEVVGVETKDTPECKATHVPVDPSAIDSSKSNNENDDTERASSPEYTPKSENSEIVVVEKRQKVPPIDGSPPPPPSAARDAEDKSSESKSSEDKDKPVKAKVKEESDGDTSDSPVEDWEELYSSDDYSPKPRPVGPSQPAPSSSKKDDSESEEDDMPAPWNAVCVVGLRVYSKVEDLEVHTVLDTEDNPDGWRGERAQAELDDGQVNAGGPRSDEKGNSDLVNPFTRCL